MYTPLPKVSTLNRYNSSKFYSGKTMIFLLIAQYALWAGIYVGYEWLKSSHIHMVSLL